MFISVDLKVIEGRALAVARAAGTSEDRVLAGLVRLWHRVWAEEADHFDQRQLGGVFGAEGIDHLLAALVSFGFLEPADDVFRVRGASRYLKLKTSRKLGAEKTNQKRWAGRSRATPGDALERPGAMGGASLNVALSPITDHRSPITEKTTTDRPPPPADSGEGFWQWAQRQRVEHGLAEEKPLAPARLATWFTQAMLELNGDRARLERAYGSYTDSDYWKTQKPPWPFGGFISQWRDHVPRQQRA